MAGVDRLRFTVEQVRCRTVVLSASACESARLLLNSKTSRHPQGLANENGQVGKYADEEYHMYARHGESPSPDPQHCADLFDMGIALNRGYADKPEELLQSDSKYAKGHNPMVGADSAANK